MKQRLSTLTKRGAYWLTGSLVAVLALVGGLLYATRPAHAAPITSLHIEGADYNGTQLDDNPSGNGWSYNRLSNTLTLDGYNSS